MKSFNKLSAAQIERLAKLTEECGEVTQAAMKVMRRGYDRKHPRKPGPTNRRHLETELGDLASAIFMLIQAGDLNENRIQKACEEKMKNVKRYLYHN